MDFVGPFPVSKEADYLWVVICCLTSLVHLVPVMVTITAAKLAWLFLTHVVRLHGLPGSIMSNHNPRFISAFWQETHQLLSVKLQMSTAFHLQMDSTTEWAIHSVSQVLQSMVQPDQMDWAEHIPMVKFTINASISMSTGFALFKLTYGYMPHMLAELPEDWLSTPRGVWMFVEKAMLNLSMVHDTIIKSCINQTFYANQCRWEEHPFREGELVYLSMENLNLSKG